MGWIWDIKKYAIHDGPGIRTTVFLKGCPLSCMWCHNPEGQSKLPQVMRSRSGERRVGKDYTAMELAGILNAQADILRFNEGGVTFSGGEPLMQAGFVAEVMDLLDGVHILLDTSGYGLERDFRTLVDRADLVFFDLKLIDSIAHHHYTGCDNERILKSLSILEKMGKPFIVRVPLVPGVTDSDQNLAGIAGRVANITSLERVELLPYNKAAGAKYESAGMVFSPEYDENQALNLNTAIFTRVGIQVMVV